MLSLRHPLGSQEQNLDLMVGMADSPNCRTCGVEKTTKHLLCDFPTYEDERSALRTVLGNLDDRPFTEETILGRCRSALCKATKALLHFLNVPACMTACEWLSDERLCVQTCAKLCKLWTSIPSPPSIPFPHTLVQGSLPGSAWLTCLPFFYDLSLSLWPHAKSRQHVRHLPWRPQ